MGADLAAWGGGEGNLAAAGGTAAGLASGLPAGVLSFLRKPKREAMPSPLLPIISRRMQLSHLQAIKRSYYAQKGKNDNYASTGGFFLPA
jgi:hypothetical protein